MSNQAHSYAEWMQCRNFWLRQVEFVSAEERVLLEDGEFTLCDTSTACVFSDRVGPRLDFRRLLGTCLF